MSGSDESNQENSPIIADMILAPEEEAGRAGLIVEPDAGINDSFNKQLEETLQRMEDEVRPIARIGHLKDPSRSWHSARMQVESLRPVPWFIWRLANFVLGKPNQITPLSEGLVLGLRRLLFAAASDKVLGSGQKVNTVRRALQVLPPDVIAAFSVIHAICRRLHSRQFERIWRPILDDAILRAHIGYYVGQVRADFGPGRGMLAGFSGRCGLAILIACGELEQARKALEMLARGAGINEVGIEIYDCNPLQVSAMTLSAAGCGRDAAYGTVAYASETPLEVVHGEAQSCWLAAFAIAEGVRMDQLAAVDNRLWQTLGYNNEQDRVDLTDMVKSLVRRGHGWNWLV